MKIKKYILISIIVAFCFAYSSITWSARAIPPIATITDISGSGLLKFHDISKSTSYKSVWSWKRVSRAGEPIFNGNEVRVTSGKMIIAYNNNAILKVEEGSRVVISKENGRSKAVCLSDNGAELTVGNVKVVLMKDQGILARSAEDGRIFLSATTETKGVIKVWIWHTIIRMEKGTVVSIGINRTIPQIEVRCEAGVVEVIKNNGENIFLNSGQRLEDKYGPLLEREVVAPYAEQPVSPSGP